MNLNMQSVSRTAEAIEWASVPRENPQKRSFGRRAWACVLLMLIGLVFFTTADAAATYYVSSSSGSDANPGTQSAPWKTLAKVYNSRPLFKPGDSILLRRGDTWYEIFNIAHQAGVSGTPITYGTYGSGVLPTVDAQNARLFGVYMDNVSHIVVRDLRTINATADGFRIVAAMGNVSDIVVQGVISEKNTRDGFSVEARVGVTHVDALEYHDDVAHLNGRSGFHAYNVSDGATGIHYYGCKATYNGQLSANHGFSAFYANNIHYHEVEAAFTNIDPATGLSNGYTSEGIGISFDDYTNNSSVEHSYLHDNARTGLVLAHRGSNNTASYNVIASNGVYGLVVNGKTGSNNIQILNNTIYGNKGYGIQAWQPINGLAIKNNILVNNVGYGIGFSATGITNSTVAANLFFGNTHGTMSYVPGATGTIVADPAFTAPASRDFSLQASSPAINRGLYLGAPYQLGLKKGSIWPFTVLLQDQGLSSWDIGSFVYTSGGPTPSTTVLVSSANPSLLGASVTFTASVTGVAPTGTVNFTDGGTSITGCAARSLSGSGNTRTGTCTTANLTSGPHSIVASYAGDAGSGASSSGVLFQVVDMSASTFSDVLTGYWAYAAIEAIAYNSITLGCASNPLRFCPDGDVRRDEMAVFVERATRGIGFSFAPTGVVFSDVPSTHWAVGPIEQFYHDGITKGCGVSPLRFCPHNSVTRAEIAIFLLRARFGAGYNPGESTGLVFSDVPATHWAAAWIEEFAARGYTTGCGMTPPRFCPDVVVTRAEMAVFLQRLFNLAGPPP